MKKFKSHSHKISIFIVIGVTSVFIWNTLMAYKYNPNNSYREHGTSMTAHQIRIDDYYTVKSMSHYYSILRYDSHDGNYIDYTDALYMVNWNEHYIVA